MHVEPACRLHAPCGPLRTLRSFSTHCGSLPGLSSNVVVLVGLKVPVPAVASSAAVAAAGMSFTSRSAFSRW